MFVPKFSSFQFFFLREKRDFFNASYVIFETEEKGMFFNIEIKFTVI